MLKIYLGLRKLYGKNSDCILELNLVYLEKKKKHMEYNKILRFIKPIEISIAEDPLRILRAFRFKEQYNLTFVGNEEEILFKHKDLLSKINKQKILEERSKYKKVGGKKYDELFK